MHCLSDLWDGVLLLIGCVLGQNIGGHHLNPRCVVVRYGQRRILYVIDLDSPLRVELEIHRETDGNLTQERQPALYRS